MRDAAFYDIRGTAEARGGGLVDAGATGHGGTKAPRARPTAHAHGLSGGERVGFTALSDAPESGYIRGGYHMHGFIETPFHRLPWPGDSVDVDRGRGGSLRGSESSP